MTEDENQVRLRVTIMNLPLVEIVDIIRPMQERPNQLREDNLEVEEEIPGDPGDLGQVDQRNPEVEQDNPRDPPGRDENRNDPFDFRQHGNLLDLVREWLLIQLGHNCSTAVCDAFFDFAWDHAEVFVRLKMETANSRATTRQLREKVMNKNIPDVFMDFVFQEKNNPNDDIHIMNCRTFPKRQYPPDQYNLISQMTRVNVS